MAFELPERDWIRISHALTRMLSESDRFDRAAQQRAVTDQYRQAIARMKAESLSR